MRLDGHRFFPHKLNKDRSYDSICLNCLATVARTTTEAELLSTRKFIYAMKGRLQNVVSSNRRLRTLGQQLNKASLMPEPWGRIKVANHGSRLRLSLRPAMQPQ